MKGKLEITKTELCQAISNQFLNYNGVIDPEKTTIYYWLHDGLGERMEIDFETKPPVAVPVLAGQSFPSPPSAPTVPSSDIDDDIQL